MFQSRNAALGIVAIASLLTCPHTTRGEGERLTIVADGKSEYSIVVPDDADQLRIGKAVELLQSVVAQATGVKPPVLNESALKDGAPAIYLGKSQAARKADLPVDKVQGWAYLNRTVGRDIFLVGQDGPAGIRERPDIEYLGTLKAVTAFLEAQVGVRFLLPAAYGRYVPKLERLSVDAAMDVSWYPRFDYVTGRTTRDRAYAVANNLFGSSPVLYTYGGHSYYNAVPAKTYGKEHPEYFALIGGVRTVKGNHLCISNREVQELMLKEMEKALDQGFEWVELAQTDGYQQCRCAECAAIHPEPGERTWIVHRALAEEMRKRRPDKKVMMISYPPTHNPPKTFGRFPDNVVIQMSRYSPNEFAAWERLGVDKSVYVYNWGHYHVPGFGPKRTPRYAVEQIRLFLKNRVRGIYICGGFRAQGSYGLEGPVYYAYGKALADPDRRPDELLKEYVDAGFGEAAVPMRAFFSSMFDRLEAFSVFSRPNTPATGVASPYRTPEDFYCHFFPAKLVADMSRNLGRAKAVATDERVKAHLQLVEIEFNYVKNLAAIFQLYRAYRIDPNWKALELLGAKVEERKRLLEAAFPGGKPMQIKGLPSPFGGAPKSWVEPGGKGGALLGAPLNWDFALLRKQGVLPGVGSKSLEVPRVEGIKLDGRLDEPSWKEAKPEALGEIGMGALKNITHFKVVHDKESVIFGVVCEFDKVECLDAVKAVGQDGAAWAQECVEIMIDPIGERQKHCQFIINPAPESTYDARYAYIEDPVHPLYGKRDSSWNGEWQYVAVVDREQKRWTVEIRIPFTTLEVQPPGPGTSWTMNLGRTEYPDGYKAGPVYSLWSPNLETRSFHDRSTFGDVTFK